MNDVTTNEPKEGPPVIIAGQTAVITAGAHGIGRSVADGLVRRGMNIVIADLDGPAAERAAAELRAAGGACIGLACDVRDEADLDRVRVAAINEYGQTDLLMNHAGMSVNGPVEQIPIANWEQLLDLNVLGMVRGLRVFLPDMLSRSAGHVVFTTSSLALLSGHPHASAAVPYITSKAAVIGLAQSVERYLAPHGIGVTLFAPDYTATAFPLSVRRFVTDNSHAAPVSASVPYPAQTPEQAADVLLSALENGAFLASATEGADRLLLRQAQGLLDPSALTPSYFTMTGAGTGAGATRE